MYQAIRPVMLKEGPDCEQSGETKEDLRRASEGGGREEEGGREDRRRIGQQTAP
jgi:hypothetical protein